MGQRNWATAVLAAATVSVFLGLPQVVQSSGITAAKFREESFAIANRFFGNPTPSVERYVFVVYYPSSRIPNKPMKNLVDICGSPALAMTNTNASSDALTYDEFWRRVDDGEVYRFGRRSSRYTDTYTAAWSKYCFVARVHETTPMYEESLAAWAQHVMKQGYEGKTVFMVYATDPPCDLAEETDTLFCSKVMKEVFNGHNHKSSTYSAFTLMLIYKDEDEFFFLDLIDDVMLTLPWTIEHDVGLLYGYYVYSGDTLLYPFGLINGDMKTSRGGRHRLTPKDYPIRLDGSDVVKIVVRIRGTLEFSTDDSGTTSYIHVFWSKKILKAGSTTLYYRQVSDPVLVETFVNDIVSVHPCVDGFQPTVALLYTWHNLRYRRADGLTNTFQAALISDGTSSYAILKYKSINYAVDESMVGLISKDLNPPNQFYEGDLLDIDQGSNVDMPGRYILKIDGPLNDTAVMTVCP